MKNLALVTLAVAPVSVAAPILELWCIENNISTEETWTFDVHKQAIRDVIIIQLKNLGKSFDVHKCLCMSCNSRNLGLLMCAMDVTHNSAAHCSCPSHMRVGCHCTTEESV